MNKNCLAIMFQNEAHWLKIHLPYLIAPDHYDLIMLDGGSHDGGAEIAEFYGAEVRQSKFEWDWSKQANTLIKMAKSRNYERMIRLDPDELMYIADIVDAFTDLERTDVVFFPRFNFEVDRDHYCKELYPDIQARGFQIAKVHYQGKVHEHLVIEKCSTKCYTDKHIYHYEGLNSMPYRALKGLNYQRVAQGLKPFDTLPREYASMEMKPRPNVEFHFPQPASFANNKTPFGE